MKLYRFDSSTGNRQAAYGSEGFIVSHVGRMKGALFVVSITLEPDGVIGRHQAVGPQLFMVVVGAGDVSGDDGVTHPIQAGQAALWSAGEMHETRTNSGLSAIVIEGDGIDPQDFAMEAM